MDRFVVGMTFEELQAKFDERYEPKKKLPGNLIDSEKTMTFSADDNISRQLKMNISKVSAGEIFSLSANEVKVTQNATPFDSFIVVLIKTDDPLSELSTSQSLGPGNNLIAQIEVTEDYEGDISLYIMVDSDYEVTGLTIVKGSVPVTWEEMYGGDTELSTLKNIDMSKNDVIGHTRGGYNGLPDWGFACVGFAEERRAA